MPEDKSTMVAPLAKAVVFHLGEAFKTKDAMKKHINEFAINPTREKAICKSIKRFGLMPSLNGSVRKEELEKISEWMVNNLSMTQEEHQAMQKGNHESAGSRPKQS